MSALKKLAVAAVSSSVAPGTAFPALADWRNDDGTSFGEVFAFVRSADGTTSLKVGCDWDSDLLSVCIGERYETTASYAASAPLTVMVNGETFNLASRFRNPDGELAVEASDTGNDVASVFRAIRDAAGPIGAAFFQTRLTFPAENASSAVGKMIHGCSTAS